MYVSEDNYDKQGQQLLRSNMFSLSGSGFFGAVGRSIDLGKARLLIMKRKSALFMMYLSLY